MKRLKSKAGFSLMELIVTMLIMMILTAGILFCMDAGTKIYQESVFESHSALLADTLNNSLSDILRNSTNVRNNDGTLEDTTTGNVLGSEQTFVFNNSNYAAQNAYILSLDGILRIKSLNNTEEYELVNTGAYPDLSVKNLEIRYCAKDTADKPGSQYGGYFTISYRIQSTKSESLFRDVNLVVRLLNDP